MEVGMAESVVAGVVEEIYIAPAGGAPMEHVKAVEAVAREGLRGDRYLERSGFWTGVDECQVTLIEAEALEDIAADTGLRVANGEHRRNLITRGVRLYDLAGKHFSVGEAVLEYDRPRPPCGYIQRLTQRGMTKALQGGRGGICARVVQGGTIRAHDRLIVL
jgi:MOSC domain-containing protein YiiM